MKITELIKALERIKAEHGDLTMFIDADYAGIGIGVGVAYNCGENGDEEMCLIEGASQHENPDR